MPRWFGTGALVGLVAFGSPQPARAIPIFAHQYGVTCEKCHSVIPHLTEFGTAFMANGDRIPAVQPGPAIPLAMKTNLVDSSENQGDGVDGRGLRKAIVDEIELFTAGAIGSRGSFLVEQYAVDGGMPGSLRDAWVADRLSPWGARIPVQVQAGQFALPLPVDPETFRETYQDYAPFVQQIGANPFDFKAPELGARVQVGDPLRGLNLQLFAGAGVMENLTDTMGPVALSVYHYQGLRALSSGSVDNFTRTGYGLTYNAFGRWTSESVLQNGWDSGCGFVAGAGCASSSGFTQLRYAFSRRLFAQARYEGSYDPLNGLARDGVLMLGYGIRENARATIEDAIAHTPQTTNTLNVQVTVAL